MTALAVSERDAVMQHHVLSLAGRRLRLCDDERRPAGKSSGAYRLALPCDEAHRVASTDVIENRPEISTEHRGSAEYVFGSLYRLPPFPHRDSPRA
jgi:hypothetical protein